MKIRSTGDNLDLLLVGVVLLSLGVLWWYFDRVKQRRVRIVVMIEMVPVKTPTCSVCGKESTVYMSVDDYEKLMSGVDHIQDIFPTWTPDQRELLISGTHPDCWNKIFTEGDWEDEEDAG